MIGGPVARAGAVLLAASLAILPSTASAVEFYFGLGTGQAKSSDYDDYVDDGTFTAGSVEGSDTGLRLFGGVGFARNFGVELAYVDLGESTTRAQSSGGGIWPAGSVAHDLGTSGIEASVFSRLAVSDSANIGFRLGLLAWDADESAAYTGGSFSRSESGADLLFAVGGEYRITPRIGLRGDYTFYKIGTLAAAFDVSLLSVSAALYFGKIDEDEYEEDEEDE